MSLHVLLCLLSVFLWATVGAVGTVLEIQVTTLTTFTEDIVHAFQHSESQISRVHNTPTEIHFGGKTTLIPRANVQQPKPFSTCHGSCAPLFASLEECYHILQNHIDLSEPSQDTKYRHCVCNAESATNPLNYACPDSPYDLCLQCISSSDLDISLQSNFTQTFYGFCSTDKASVFLFLYTILNFLLRAQVPEEFPVISGPIRTITKYAEDFTVLAGMNEPPVTRGSLPPFPTDWLTQLPPNWPYTSYGVARRPGQSTTWTLTDPHTEGQAVAVVVASLQWYPRPLGKQKGLDVARDWPRILGVTEAAGEASATETTTTSSSDSVELAAKLTDNTAMLTASATWNGETPISQTQTQTPIQTPTPLARGRT